MNRFLLAGATAVTLLGTAAGAQTMDGLRWENRVLVLLSDHADAAPLREQERLVLADRDALRERDLAVLAVEGETLRSVFGPFPDGETARSLRERLHVALSTGFAAVLVGKDGGVKWTAREPTPLRDINAVIDAMPMRRAGRG